jgi:hypothetical protein
MCPEHVELCTLQVFGPMPAQYKVILKRHEVRLHVSTGYLQLKANQVGLLSKVGLPSWLGCSARH